MQILKWLGGVLILWTGGFAALSCIRFEKRKITVLDGWIDLILYIRAQVDCYLLPLGEILSGADRALLHACQWTQGKTDLTSIYHASSLFLEPESRRLLCNFCREVGCGYREELLRRCDYYASVLRGIREKKQDEFGTKKKIILAVCFSLAAGILILLW